MFNSFVELREGTQKDTNSVLRRPEVDSMDKDFVPHCLGGMNILLEQKSLETTSMTGTMWLGAR